MIDADLLKPLLVTAEQTRIAFSAALGSTEPNNSLRIAEAQIAWVRALCDVSSAVTGLISAAENSDSTAIFH